MAQHHTLWCRRRARGVLEKSQRFAAYQWLTPGFCQVMGNTVGVQPAQRLQIWGLAEPFLYIRHNGCSGEGHCRLRVCYDSLESGGGPVAPGRISGDSHNPSVEASEKSGDIFQPRWVEQKRTLSSWPPTLEPST